MNRFPPISPHDAATAVWREFYEPVVTAWLHGPNTPVRCTRDGGAGRRSNAGSTPCGRRRCGHADRRTPAALVLRLAVAERVPISLGRLVDDVWPDGSGTEGAARVGLDATAQRARSRPDRPCPSGYTLAEVGVDAERFEHSSSVAATDRWRSADAPHPRRGVDRMARSSVRGRGTAGLGRSRLSTPRRTP